MTPTLNICSLQTVGGEQSNMVKREARPSAGAAIEKIQSRITK